MKRIGAQRMYSPSLNLYPTWFRWNCNAELNDADKVKNLYPTWFRWNISELYRIWHFCSAIYIPHGSDETDFQINANLTLYNIYIPHGSDETYSSTNILTKFPDDLYPTWFRWNMPISTIGAPVMSIYIPHGSDETEKEK